MQCQFRLSLHLDMRQIQTSWLRDYDSCLMTSHSNQIRFFYCSDLTVQRAVDMIFPTCYFRALLDYRLWYRVCKKFLIACQSKTIKFFNVLHNVLNSYVYHMWQIKLNWSGFFLCCFFKNISLICFLIYRNMHLKVPIFIYHQFYF